MKSRAVLFFFLLGFLVRSGQSQSPIDSASLWKEIIILENRIFADFPKTFAKANATLKIASNSDCLGCRGRALMMVGKFYWANGQYKEGISFFRQAISIAAKLEDYDTWIKATDLIGNTFYYQAYYDSAEHYFLKAYEIAERVNDVEGMILILHNISLMSHRKGDFKRTIEFIFKGERLKNRIPPKAHHVESLGAMGSLLIDSIYYKGKIIEELRNLRHYKAVNDSMSIYYTFQNLAKSYRQLTDHQRAARYFILACTTMEGMGLIPEWDMVAIDYSDANMKDSAFYYHYLAKRNIKRTTTPSAAYTFELMADTHAHFNQIDSALFYYNLALAMNYTMNNRITFTGIHRQMVRMHTLLGNYDIAEFHLETGLKLAKEVALIHEKNLFNEGKFLFETKGDFKRALFYSEKYKMYLDSINRQEVAINLTRLQAEFETAKKESKLSEITQINLLNEEKIKARNLQVGLSVISLVLIGSFGGFYFTRFRQKKKVSETLQKQNQIIEQQYELVQKQNDEKEALLHEIHHRVKNNLQIISSLINIKTRSTSGETAGILNELNNRIHSLGLIHEMLYKSDHIDSVCLKTYLAEQSKLTLSSLESNKGAIELKIDIDQIEANLDAALALGLISNELITNAIKYAFVSEQTVKTICLTLRRSDDYLHFSIADNGALPVDSEIKKSFGLRFVEQLVKSKLGGELHIKYEQGLKVEMKLQPMA